MVKTTIRKFFYQIETALKVIRGISSQTAVHRKKFDYCIDQIQLFLTSIMPTLPQAECTKEDHEINARILSTLSTLRGIMLQYILQTWMEPTTMNPSDLILLQLQSQFNDLKSLFAHYNEQLSHIFDIDEKKWQELHLIDLTAIYTSFKNYMEQETKDPETEFLVLSRISEIEEYMSKYKKDFKTTELSSPLPEQYRKWKVNYEDFKILEKIGKGFSADVYKAIYKRTNELVAIKQFKEKNLSSNHLQHYQREIAVLSLLSEKNQPFFIELVGATDTFPICIITKYMPNGGLNDKVFKKHPTQTFKNISAYAIARGMAFLHSLNIIHRDLKSLNVLLDKDDNIKICDFGFSRCAGDSGFKTLPIGTLRWMSPEIMSGKGFYTFKVDVYAYGMVLCELVNQTRPFNKMKNDQIKKLILENDIRPDLPFDMNPELRKLITRCWDRNPEVRPTFNEIVNLFESMRVMFDGTDVAEFKKYIEKLNKTTKDDEKKVKLNKMKAGTMSLREIIDDFSTNGLPSSEISLDELWNIITDFIERSNDRVKLAILLSFFFETSKLPDAVKILRNFPRNSIPYRVIDKLINFFPSNKRQKKNDKEEEFNIDTSIAVVCCRNNAAPLVLSNATNERDIILAFEVISAEDVSLDMKKLVVESITQSFHKNETGDNVKISAMRCALALKIPEIVPIDNLINSDNLLIRNHAYACIMGIGIQGKTISSNLLISIFNKALNFNNKEHEAQAALIASCSSEGNATIILDELIKNDDILNEAFQSTENEETIKKRETIIKILMNSAKHKNLFQKIQQILLNPLLEKPEPFNDEIGSLKKHIQHNENMS